MQNKLEDMSFLLLLVVVSLTFGAIIQPFYSAIFWAAMLAILFNPLQSYLKVRFKGRDNSNALLTLSASLLIVVIPLWIVLAMLGVEGAAFYKKVSSGEFRVQESLDQIKSAIPVIESLAERFNIDLLKVKELLSKLALGSSKYFATQAFSFGQQYVLFAINFVLMVYLTFFFLRDGHRLIELLVRALPLGDARERHLFQKFAEVSRAVIKGNLVVAVVQGSMGGAIFWLLGIEGAMLWGVVMVILSLLPAVGSALIWAPAALYLFVTGAVIKGIILVLFGFFAIGLVDNILRPILVGRDTKMPDYLVLLSTIGGITLFGLNGFVIGPVLAALFLAFWQIFIDEFNTPPFSDALPEDETGSGK
ncbi:MAG: AI-2E family transporter [Proteobacteria bacterium]|nr:MAG: AI-2E family transporter [Pseudomonadota bacterium]